MQEKIQYPQYRKYSNGKSYFKILSHEEFEEIQVAGNTKVLYHFKAKILPDRNYIYDLTFNYREHWEVCDKEEYEALKKMAHSS